MTKSKTLLKQLGSVLLCLMMILSSIFTGSYFIKNNSNTASAKVVIGTTTVNYKDLYTLAISSWGGKYEDIKFTSTVKRVLDSTSEQGKKANKQFLGDGLKNDRSVYCVEPHAGTPSATTNYTIDAKVSDTNSSALKQELRTLLYYSPGYPGYDKLGDSSQKAIGFTGEYDKDYMLSHYALSMLYDKIYHANHGEYRSRGYYAWRNGADSDSDSTSAAPYLKPSSRADYKELIEDKYIDVIIGHMDDKKYQNDVPDGFSLYMVYASGVQDLLVGGLESGNIKITKASAFPQITNGNSCYSLEGAVFKIYDKDNELVDTLKTDAKGIAPLSCDLDPGTYTVKETTAPKGYSNKDAAGNIMSKKVTVSSGKTATVSFTDIPQADPIYIALNKVDNNGNPVSQGAASLAGAEYTFKYYDGIYDSVDAAEKSGKSTRTWVFKTAEIAGQYQILPNNKECKVTEKSDEFYTDARGAVIFPVGSVVIQETKAPEGYTLDPTKTIVKITEDGADLPYIDTYNIPVQNERVFRGGVSLDKMDFAFGKPIAQGGASLEDIEFEITNANENPVIVRNTDNLSSDENQVDWDNITTESDKIKTVEDGERIGSIFTSWDDVNNSFIAKTAFNNDLPYGTYTIKEVKSNESYHLTDGDARTFKITEDGVYVLKNIDDEALLWKNQVIRGGIEIEKQDEEMKESGVTIKGASLEGIEFEITNANENSVIVRNTDNLSSDGNQVDWNKVTIEDKKVKEVKSGDVVGRITTKYDKDTNSFIAKTAYSNDLPYGTYTVKEVKSNESYKLTDLEEKILTINEEGVYIRETFYNQAVRGDLSLLKANEKGKALSNIPFAITNKETGETHVVVTDKNGKINTSGDHLNKTNANDSILKLSENGKNVIKNTDLDSSASIYFGAASNDTNVKPGKALNAYAGAMPYGEYSIQELRCENNEGLELVRKDFTISEDSSIVDLGTIVDKPIPIAPKTGDDRRLFEYFIFLGIGIAGLIYGIRKLSKKDE